MDITLPDGVILKGVPDGATKEQVLNKLLQVKHPSAQALLDRVAQENTLADTSGMGKFNAGVGGALTRIGQAAKQMVGMDTDYQRDKGATEALNRTGPGLAGNIAGNVMALAPLAMVPGAGSIGGALTIGALTGAIQPTDNASERMGNMAMGGALGAGVQYVARYPAEIWDAAKGVGRGLRATVEPFTEGGRTAIMSRVLRNASEGNPAAAARMAGAQELIPGSVPTAAEVAQSPGIAALQRTMAATNPEAYATRAAQQNEARVAALQDMAGAGGRREAITAIRDEGANEMYRAAIALGIDPDLMTRGRKGEITKLLQRPAIQDALAKARTLAKNEGVNIGNPAGSVKGLDYLKRALDDQISAADGNERRILVALKDRLLTTVDTLSPAYQGARQWFAEMSQIPNQMGVAERLAEKSIRPLDNTLNPAAYARNLNDDLAIKATGNNRATLESVMEPEQLARLNAIKEDLARSVAARDLGRGPGSDTVQKLAMSNLLQRSGLPESVLRTPLLGRVGNWAYENADARMKQQLAETLLDPQQAARILNAAPAQGLPATTPRAIGDRSAALARMLMMPAMATAGGQ